MAEFDRKIEAVVDITRPAFEGIEEFTPKEVGRVGEVVAENFTVLGNRNRPEEQTVTDPYANILNDETEPMDDLPF